MFRHILITTTLSLGLSLGLTACSGNDPQAANGSVSNETGMGNGAMSTMVEDGASRAVGAASAPMVNDAPSFVTAAAMSDMYEIEAAKIAAEKSKSADVKSFAQMMIKDHGATSAKLKSLIAEAKLDQKPPMELDDRRAGMIANLKSAPAAEFDKVYLDQQVAAHEEALSVMKSFADDGEQPQLKAFAAETAPKIQQHYDHARKLDEGNADKSE